MVSNKGHSKKAGHKRKRLFMPACPANLRQIHGPDLMKSVKLLGQEKVIARIKCLL